MAHMKMGECVSGRFSGSQEGELYVKRFSESTLWLVGCCKEGLRMSSLSSGGKVRTGSLRRFALRLAGRFGRSRILGKRIERVK
jgi:hypothetical protein